MVPFELARRMYESAMDRIYDADLLSSQFGARSDSAAWLRTLGLEVLLKTVLLFEQGVPSRSHKYKDLWNRISESGRREILASAEGRFPGYADLSALDTIFDRLEEVFTKARYEYEKHGEKTDQEIRALSQDWIDQGAQEAVADISYKPFERDALIAGLREFLEARLNIRYDTPIG